MKHIDLNVMIILSFDISLGLIILFCFCHFGRETSENFGMMSECLYECNWPDLSAKLTKYLILMIQNAQTPIHYQGFKIVPLNMETFSKVHRLAMRPPASGVTNCVCSCDRLSMKYIKFRFMNSIFM